MFFVGTGNQRVVRLRFAGGGHYGSIRTSSERSTPEEEAPHSTRDELGGSFGGLGALLAAQLAVQDFVRAPAAALEVDGLAAVDDSTNDTPTPEPAASPAAFVVAVETAAAEEAITEPHSSRRRDSSRRQGDPAAAKRQQRKRELAAFNKRLKPSRVPGVSEILITARMGTEWRAPWSMRATSASA
jgi:hypothetical protein